MPCGSPPLGVSVGCRRHKLALGVVAESRIEWISLQTEGDGDGLGVESEQSHRPSLELVLLRIAEKRRPFISLPTTSGVVGPSRSFESHNYIHVVERSRRIDHASARHGSSLRKYMRSSPMALWTRRSCATRDKSLSRLRPNGACFSAAAVDPLSVGYGP